MHTIAQTLFKPKITIFGRLFSKPRFSWEIREGVHSGAAAQATARVWPNPEVEQGRGKRALVVEIVSHDTRLQRTYFAPDIEVARDAAERAYREAFG